MLEGRKFFKILERASALLGFAALFGLLIYAGFDANDYTLSIKLQHYSNLELSRFMERSLFEGGSFGASDFATLLCLTCIPIYGTLLYLDVPALRKLRLACSYILVTNLWLAAVVHVTKAAMARPRPNDVLQGNIDFFSWFEATKISMNTWTHGSLPSGHTASAMSLFCLVYLIPPFSNRLKGLRIVSAFFVALFTAVMAVSRVMQGAHWISDTLLAIMLSWLVIHVTYYYGLKVPQRMHRLEQYPAEVWHSDFVWLGRMLLLTLGYGIVLLAYRFLVYSDLRWGLLGILVSLAIAQIYRKNLRFISMLNFFKNYNAETKVWIICVSILCIGLCLRFYFAWSLPLSNDEAYYWDWGQDLQLSYLDHPPFVAYLTYLGQFLAQGTLGIRIFGIIAHSLSCIGLLLCLWQLDRTRFLERAPWLAWGLLIIPGFSLAGIVILPDSGLYLGLTATLFCIIRFALLPHLRLRHAFVLGLAMGIAGLSKYQSLPLAFGLGLGLISIRFDKLRAELKIYALAIATALLVTLPVWIWNMQNNWASFAFQAHHGFGAGSFNIKLGLRAILGQILFLTPLLWWLTFRSLVSWLTKTGKPLPLHRIGILGFLPLFGLVTGAAFFKESLVHWVMPAFWVLLPWIVISESASKVFTNRFNLVYALSMSLILPALFSSPSLRKQLLKHFNGDPGPINELTLWPELAQAVDARIGDRNYPLAAFRWYTVAQLRFHRKPEEKVFALEENRPNYYSFRDISRPTSPFFIVMTLAEKQQLTGMLSNYKILEEHRLSPRLHERMIYELLLVQSKLIKPE